MLTTHEVVEDEGPLSVRATHGVAQWTAQGDAGDRSARVVAWLPSTGLGRCRTHIERLPPHLFGSDQGRWRSAQWHREETARLLGALAAWTGFLPCWFVTSRFFPSHSFTSHQRPLQIRPQATGIPGAISQRAPGGEGCRCTGVAARQCQQVDFIGGDLGTATLGQRGVDGNKTLRQTKVMHSGEQHFG